MGEKLDEAKAAATTQIAKTAEKGLDLLSGAGKFFDQVLGEGLRHVGGSFTDWAAVFRYENAFKLADKIEAIHAARGITSAKRSIEPRLAIPLIQASTMESDEELQTLWAGMIANATDPNLTTNARRDFVTLLSALEPIDLRCLLAISEHMTTTAGKSVVQTWSAVPNESERPKRNITWLCSVLGKDPDLIKISVESLERQGLIVDRTDDPDDDFAGQIIVPVTHKEADLWLSYTGEALLSACKA
ncbi:DUF4393 domain-containing protein [Devosia oryziradicis]|uniref:DUF4393 domain-containing protein n=1 Tax=Devosia oryziradicis TaxID=2801335 RepID=A0ABX7BXF8_9HYPH|nr:Abi-alpha family protein [Devosia oryziradicis]QQR36648.1 DUF4393 domain-containing protein [Devosia oryziradicis]